MKPTDWPLQDILKRVAWMVALVGVLWPALPVHAHEPMSILIVHSYEEFIPWNQSFTEGLLSWQAEHPEPVQIYREYMHSPDLASSHDQAFWGNYLKQKYAGVTLDALVGESAEAAEIVQTYGKSISPDAISLYHTAAELPLSPTEVHLPPETGELVRKTVDFALRRHPGLRNVAVIDGQSALGEITADYYLELLQRRSDLKIHHLINFTLDELEAEVRALPSGTIIFYTLVFNDRNGVHFIPKVVLNHILAATPAPVYVNYSSLMGTGAIGGYVIDGATLARQALQATLDYHQRGVFAREGYRASLPLFDWKAMQERGVSTRDLPDSAVVINPPTSFYELYETAIWITVGILLAGLTLAMLRARHLSLLNSRLNSLAMNDPLTGLYNRRALTPHIVACLKAPSGEKQACLILCDIDDFKQINDTYGHQTGDDVLIEVAKRLRSELRKSDAVSRWGGEEFLILLQDISLEEGRQLAEKLRDSIRSSPMTQAKLTVTMSLSVAPLNTYATFEACFKELDRMLYVAKHSGKDCVRVAAPDSVPSC